MVGRRFINDSGVAALLLLVACAVLAQQPATVPVDQEPHHKVVFKNDYVRVVDATFPSGYVTLNHAHAVDNVAVTISSGRDGEAATQGVGRASFSKGGYSHTVTNRGPGVMRFIDVEIFKTDRPNAAAAMLPKHTLETENDRVRIYRVKLSPGESVTNHMHGAGWIEVVVAGEAAAGAFSWHPAGVEHTLNAGNMALEIVELEPR